MIRTIVANLKMNLLSSEIYHYLDKLYDYTNKHEPMQRIIIAPSFICLEKSINYIKKLDDNRFSISAQNMSEYTKGSYTGEVSCNMLKDIGCNHVILGHYERYKYYNENTEATIKKIKLALDANINIILCVKSHKDKLLEHIKELNMDSNKVVIAYEPTEYIGSDDAIDISSIKVHLSSIYNTLGNKYNIYYGGSVDNDNIHQISQISEIDGVLIGRQSENIKDLFKIINKVN